MANKSALQCESQSHFLFSKLCNSYGHRTWMHLLFMRSWPLNNALMPFCLPVLPMAHLNVDPLFAYDTLIPNEFHPITALIMFQCSLNACLLTISSLKLLGMTFSGRSFCWTFTSGNSSLTSASVLQWWFISYHSVQLLSLGYYFFLNNGSLASTEEDLLFRPASWSVLYKSHGAALRD